MCIRDRKIDYAIMRDGDPIILIECKHIEEELNSHDNQLLRYYHVSCAKFGILTNGMEYRFYTDLDEPNKMDEKPFLVLNMLDLRDSQIEEVKQFHKSYFDVENIVNAASELKYMKGLKAVSYTHLFGLSGESRHRYVSDAMPVLIEKIKEILKL